MVNFTNLLYFFINLILYAILYPYICFQSLDQSNVYTYIIIVHHIYMYIYIQCEYMHQSICMYKTNGNSQVDTGINHDDHNLMELCPRPLWQGITKKMGDKKCIKVSGQTNISTAFHVSFREGKVYGKSLCLKLFPCQYPLNCQF